MRSLLFSSSLPFKRGKRAVLRMALKRRPRRTYLAPSHAAEQSNILVSFRSVACMYHAPVLLPGPSRQRGELKDNANRKKHNQIDNDESYRVQATEDIIIITQQKTCSIGHGLLVFIPNDKQRENNSVAFFFFFSFLAFS